MLVHETLKGTTNHGVLTHQDDGLSTEGDTDLVHLLGADIVNSNDEDGAVLIETVIIIKIVRNLESCQLRGAIEEKLTEHAASRSKRSWLRTCPPFLLDFSEDRLFKGKSVVVVVNGREERKSLPILGKSILVVRSLVGHVT